MNNMDQLEHIEAEIQKSIKYQAQEIKIQELYEKCKIEFSQSTFSELINILDNRCLSWIRKKLWAKGCYSLEIEDDIMQEARIAVWEAILKDSESNNFRDSFAKYAFGIYKIKGLDYIRKNSKERKNIPTESIDEGFEKGSSEPKGNDPKGKEIPSPIIEDGPTIKEKARLYNGLFKKYCFAFLNSKASPPRPLALYYARVLAHFLEVIPDTKASSGKWAFNRMSGLTIQQLKIDSENTLHKCIDNTLSWGDSFLNQLEEIVELNDKTILMKDLIYSDKYDYKQTGRWADYLHGETLKTAREAIKEDKELYELIKAYITDRDVLYGFIERKGER